ncbi:integral membrane protein [Protomyces lactucae-debilis]|uniref:Integral membrane protein n=1 Tax=Protomyces lactucae-debilis TaxID=2754530 RepID=A0A1Y2FK03_PROLT|nr:uncharacterized protein BCR37DRAFT_276368 [Protomyces lactucae-debilis]ORY83704.1 integral membrane protein [Protomyces lactucae-debilis]
MAKATILVLVAGMLLTGCLNTLLLKYQGLSCNQVQRHGAFTGCASFPIWQSFFMFMGEALCLAVIGIVRIWLWARRDRGYVPIGVSPVPEDEEHDTDLADSVLLASMQQDSPNPPLEGLATLYLALPAFFDICGTTIMSVGLLLTTASTFQMLRGALVLFVGFFSVIFLKRRLLLHQWTALALVTAGVFLVGLSSLTGKHEKSSKPQHTLLGVLLITGAQVFSASQFVLEDYILSRYAVEPLKVAGFEGVFGVILTTTAMVIAYVFYGSSAGQDGTFDIGSGIITILEQRHIWLSFVLFAISIPSFNFFGLSVTKSVSATSRSTIDACRTLFIWAASLALGWESFKALQLLGFAVLVYATLLFNGVVEPPRFLLQKQDGAVGRGGLVVEVDASRRHISE